MRAGAPLAHLHKHQRAVARPHDQVYLAAAAPGGFKVARQRTQARGLQVRQRGILRRVAHAFGAGLGCW
jgi:hypothetical protein